ncbi:hypothetical protein ZTR_07772 [Talaromyces verruculosus]|nr:hypothetical protein ZTR_07772 [Talaromyces verruculosus]
MIPTTNFSKAYSEQHSRPSPSHKRAIFFPPDEDKPRMTWMKCDDRDDVGFTYTLPDFSWVSGNSLLSSPGTRNIEENKIRRRRLGRGFAAWADANDGYWVALVYRDNYLNDGSIPNRSIAAPVKSSAGFRHLIDHLLVYGKETTHWPGTQSSPPPPPPFAFAPPPAPAPAAAPTPKSAEKPSPPLPSQDRTIRGGKIFCNGEGKLHGRNQFARFDFTPGKRTSLGKGHVSPISKRLGIPLILWQDPDARYSTGTILSANMEKGYKGKLRFSYDPSLAPIPQYTKRFEDYEMDPQPDSDLD